MINKSIIKNYAEVMNEMGLTCLEITEGDTVIRLEKTIEKVVNNVSVPMGMPAMGMPAVGMPDAAVQPTAPAAPTANDNYISITSPMVGVFYQAPSEDAEPFVKVGDAVKKGDTLCIIESMKLMNEITAEQDGVIKEICIANGQVVEYGSLLFKMEG